MPQIQVKTRTRVTARHGVEVVMEILLVPRGSGNRKLARALAKAAREHARLGPHVRSAAAGSSKVLVYLKPSLELTRVLWEWNRRRAEELGDVPGQLPLFGQGLLA